jgi:DNA polymerase beta
MNKEKRCPEGKVVNPLTGRCIDIKALEKKMRKIEKDAKAANAAAAAKAQDEDSPITAQPENNKKLIDNLRILADYERINKEPFKVKAYEKVIGSIELLDKNIESLEDIKLLKGVGKKIEDKIIEFLNTGSITEVVGVLNDPKYILGNKLKGIYGVGPAKIAELMTKIEDFEELKGRPELLNDKQKIGLKYYDDMNLRIPMAEGKQHLKVVGKILNNLYSDGIEFEFVGSFRRKNKDMGDIDILIKNRKGLVLKDVIKQLEDKSYIIEKLAQGNNKFMGICRLSPELPARRIDILIAEPSYYYFALLYFTGSYNFNIYMRKIALTKGLSLSEYGFKEAAGAGAAGAATNKNIIDTSDTINSEEDIFKYLGMTYVEPHRR